MNMFLHLRSTPSIILIFLSRTFLPRQEKARFLYFSANFRPDTASSSLLDILSLMFWQNSFMGGLTALLWGHTFWHSSQPKTRPLFFSIAFSSSERSPFFWLMWDAHLAMSKLPSPSAPPGQCFMHSPQDRQLFSMGLSHSSLSEHLT